MPQCELTMKPITVCVFFLITITIFCFIPSTESKKSNSSKKEDDHDRSALAGNLGVLEPEGLAGTGLLGSTVDRNGKEDRNVVKSLEKGVTGQGSLSKTTGDANIPLTKDEVTTESPDDEDSTSAPKKKGSKKSASKHHHHGHHRDD